MSKVHQRSVGVPWYAPLTVLLFLLDVVLVVPHIPGRYSLWRYVAVAVTLVPMWFAGIGPLILWRGLDLLIDDRGLRFGTSRPPARPRHYGNAIRNPWQAPWSAVGNVRLVRSREAVRLMQDAQQAAQQARYLAYFPCRGRAALVFDVDLGQVEIFPLVPSRPGVKTVAPEPSTVWAFPVRRVEPVLAALRERGIPVTETDRPVPPTTGAAS